VRVQVLRFIYSIVENHPGGPDLAGFQGGGIDGAPLEAVRYRDIAAVVSSADVGLFAPDLPGDAPAGRREGSREAHLLKFQQVNSFLLGQSGSGGMLPLKFGFTAESDEGVETVLGHAYIQLRTFLDRLRGTVELVVQASWELPKVLGKIVKDDPGLVGPDPAETGRRLFEAAGRRKRDLVAAIHDSLSPLARDYSDAPLKAESMILHRSYLVEKEKEPLFDEAVNSVATQLEETLVFRYIGPLPVYSFVNVELNQGDFVLVDRARRLLQLPEKASWDEVRAAYRQLVLAHHPDRNPGDPQAAVRTRDVTAAYEVVRAYGLSLPGFGGPGEPGELSFAREAVERAFVIDDKGAVLSRGKGTESPS